MGRRSYVKVIRVVVMTRESNVLVLGGNFR
jgi:hypothetical protein